MVYQKTPAQSTLYEPTGTRFTELPDSALWIQAYTLRPYIVYNCNANNSASDFPMPSNEESYEQHFLHLPLYVKRFPGNLHSQDWFSTWRTNRYGFKALAIVTQILFLPTGLNCQES
eukprot:12846571-Ditylum_brightwellii.AAC.1